MQQGNTTWSHLGGDLGGAQKCSRVSGAQNVLRLINTLCIYLYICIYKSRGVAYTGYNVPYNAEKEEEGEKRERYLFHHSPYYPLEEYLLLRP